MGADISSTKSPITNVPITNKPNIITTQPNIQTTQSTTQPTPEPVLYTPIKDFNTFKTDFNTFKTDTNNNIGSLTNNIGYLNNNVSDINKNITIINENTNIVNKNISSTNENVNTINNNLNTINNNLNTINNNLNTTNNRINPLEDFVKTWAPVDTYTKEQTDTLVKSIDLSPYAKISDVYSKEQTYDKEQLYNKTEIDTRMNSITSLITPAPTNYLSGETGSTTNIEYKMLSGFMPTLGTGSRLSWVRVGSPSGSNSLLYLSGAITGKMANNGPVQILIKLPNGFKHNMGPNVIVPGSMYCTYINAVTTNKDIRTNFTGDDSIILRIYFNVNNLSWDVFIGFTCVINLKQ